MRRSGMAVIVVLALIAALGLLEYRWDSSSLEAWIAAHRLWGAAIYVIVLAGSIVLLPLSSLPLLPFAVHLYGVPVTGLLSALGWWIGALIAFQVARLGRRHLERFASLELIDRIEVAIPPNLGFVGIVVLRMVFPVDLVSFALGLLKQLSFVKYASASMIGIVPFSFAWSYAGGELMAGRWLGAAGAVLVIAAGVFIARRLLGKRARQGAE